MDRFYDYFMGIATGMCLVGWGFEPPTSTIIGLVAAIVAIGMSVFSLGREVQKKTEP